MAGISAVSASKSHAHSGADVTASGSFVVNEQVTLSATPTGTSYQWELSIPAASSPARSALDDDTDGTPKFTPDVAGLYVVSVTVNGSTLYVLRLSVAAPGVVRMGEINNMLPLTDAQVPTPQTGFSFFCGADHSNLPCIKKTDGTVHTVDLTAV